ncbi:hypothetical protein FHR32_001257 [Streptosporangium album]|uniref:PPE family domain-containing protein n=1 Tax=Streptosporangium album TaxID=47479 RepID=A0A7W7RS87_9ACTN|nr:hypothetical protein [Streptosporangium album]MBB4936952.1 hypothetical protein [Streptosporangium album]
MEISKKTHFIKTVCGDFSVKGDQPVARVKQIIEGLDGPAIEKAGNAYLDACSLLAECRIAVENASKAMADCWGDRASVEAQTALRYIHSTVRELSDKGNMMGRPLESLGKALPAYKETGEGGFAPSWSENTYTFNDDWDDFYDTKDGVKWGSQNDLAKKHLEALNAEVQKWHNLLPDSLRKELPKIEPPTAPDPHYKTPPYPTGDHYSRSTPYGGNNYAGPASHTVGNDSDPFGAGNQPGDGSSDPSGGLPSGQKYPDGTPGADGSGAGGAAPSGGANDPSNGTGDPSGGLTDPTKGLTDPSGGVNDPTKGPGADDSRSTNLAEYTQPTGPDSTANPYQNTSTSNPHKDPTTTVTPTTSPTTTGGGGTSTGGGAGGAVNPASARAAGMNGMNGMPIGMGGMPSSAGQESQEQETQTWLHQDDDVWTGDHTGVVSHTIG